MNQQGMANQNRLSFDCQFSGNEIGGGLMIGRPDSDPEDSPRFFFETVGAQSVSYNMRFAQFTPECLQMMAEQYSVSVARYCLSMTSLAASLSVKRLWRV